MGNSQQYLTLVTDCAKRSIFLYNKILKVPFEINIKIELACKLMKLFVLSMNENSHWLPNVAIGWVLRLKKMVEWLFMLK